MKWLRLLTLGLAVGLVVCGCKKEGPEAEQERPGKEVPMGNTLQWFGHASFRISYGDKVIYIDPWKLTDAPHDATAVLVSHSHYDHYSAKDFAKASGPGTKIVASTMNGEEAAMAVEYIKPKQAIPYHWGDIVGERSDADRFAETAKCNVKVLTPGESIEIGG